MIIPKKKKSSKHQNKAEFKNLDDSEVLSSEPQWLLQPQKPYFTKELPGPDLIMPGTKMINTVPFSWNESSKIQIFTDILSPFFRRLSRPANVTFLKTKYVDKKFPISEFPNYFQTRFYLHISICQSQFIMSSSV
jgi:hypothetical protein